MSNFDLDLGRRGFVPQLADVVTEARRLIGWSQRELAHRAKTSQATIWRIERGRSEHLDLLATERVLTALGIRASLQLDARHLADRRRQKDAVHARINGFVARRLERDAWRPATEVAIGDGIPRGWIDILAFRDADAALLVEESKTEIPDFGALQRSLAFYQREAPFVARGLGWKPRRVVVLVAALDSAAIGRRLQYNRELVARAFPAPIDQVGAWLTDPGRTPPAAWALGMVDPAQRGGAWLRPTVLGGRRSQPAYADYADAAARLRSGRRAA